jgi:hypothetical protein
MVIVAERIEGEREAFAHLFRLEVHKVPSNFDIYVALCRNDPRWPHLGCKILSKLAQESE